jgi:creatinine amidohydrolase/Fe(II)-dependent formamide hydrolase-like protein
MSANDLLDMFPAEIENNLKSGNDIAILPVGSLEQHGPHLLLATDTFYAQAVSQEIGKRSGGTVFPLIPFSWVGCTNVFAGGIGVRESVFLDYLRAVVKRLWQSGFRRILVVNGHGGNYYALRSFPHDLFKEEGIPVFGIYGDAGCQEAKDILRKAGGGEQSGLAGALRLLGREDLLAEIQENTRRAVAEFGDRPSVQLEPKSARESRSLGVVGHDYSHECLHVQPDSHIDAEAGAEAIRKVAEHVAKSLDAFRSYVNGLQKE